MQIQGYAAKQAKQQLEPFSYEVKELGGNDVEIAISHCGICHSDVHLVDNDWGISAYPLIPGHEIVGTVTNVGKAVKHLTTGQRVGVGWQAGSCMHCELCLNGQENLCQQSQPTCVGRFGGFATAIHINNEYVFPIPEELSSENAAPLLCAGITVYNALRTHEVTSNMRVGVIGIGGLGHLALQFANAMGCEVTALSSNQSKEHEAIEFGAHHFLNIDDKEKLNQAIGSLNFILVTASADLDWPTIINLLKPTGKLCFVGIPLSTLNIPAFPLIAGQRTICGSAIGSRATMLEMLDFCARHKIVAKTQIKQMAEANEALNTVRENAARYRIVLQNI